MSPNRAAEAPRGVIEDAESDGDDNFLIRCFIKAKLELESSYSL
jgi:hypothetical protein